MGMTEKRDVWFLSSGCLKCHQCTPVVTDRGGRREEDRMLMGKLGKDLMSNFTCSTYAYICPQQHWVNTQTQGTHSHSSKVIKDRATHVLMHKSRF